MSGPISNALASRTAACGPPPSEQTHKAINTTTTCPPSPSHDYLNLVQIYIFGLRGKIDSLVDFMARGGISIAAIQETHTRPNTSLKPPSGYSIIHADRPKERGKGGGLAFLIHQSVQHRVLDLPIPPGDEHLEQAFEVRTGTTSTALPLLPAPQASS